MRRTDERYQWRGRSASVVALVATGLVLMTAAPAMSQSQPIRSPQDAACRDEARDRVFTAPDPQGIGLYALGRQLYLSCMKRQSAPARAGRIKGRSAKRR